MRMKIAAISIALLSVMLSAADCSGPAPTAVDRQRDQLAAQVAVEQTYCYECNNIAKRRLLFGKPGVIGYVVFLNQAGQPVRYDTVDGKCSSSGKRLTQSKRVEWVEGTRSSEHGNADDNVYLVDGPSEDGTYGESDSYIYCFTTDGRYIQWSGDYLYSDKPFDLTIKPLVIDTSAKLTGQ